MTMAPGFGMEPTQPTLHDAGPPPPAPEVSTPAADEPDLGGRGLRLIAYIADTIIISLVVGAFFIVVVFFAAFIFAALGMDIDEAFHGYIAGLVGLVFAVAYFPFWWSRDGQTLAMMPLGLRVVDENDGETISRGRAIVRLVVLVIGIAVFLLGVLWTFVDRRRRGWHDLAAHTIVIGER
jgi:uncharacterized RDD family membrane protein YckC